MSEQEAAPEGHAAEQHPETGKHFLLGGFDDDPTGEKRLDAVRAEVEGTTDPAPDAPPAEEAASAPEQQEAESKLYAGKYQTPEELETAYGNLQNLLGHQGKEMGDLKRAVAEIQATRAVEASTQETEAKPDLPAHLARQLSEKLGLEDNEAGDLGGFIYQLVDHVAQQRVGEAEARFKPFVEPIERQKELTKMGAELAQEIDHSSGAVLRPDWNDVVQSEEFQGIWDNNPRLQTSVDGVRILYDQAKLIRETSPKTQAAEAARLKGEAQGIVDAEKQKASGGGGRARGSSSPEPKAPAKPQRHFLMGGDL